LANKGPSDKRAARTTQTQGTLTPAAKAAKAAGGAEATFELKPGATVVGVRLTEPIESGAKIASWRGQRASGSPVTVHALQPGAKQRERDNFVKAAKRLAAIRSGQALPGVIPVNEVVLSVDMYIAELSASGTMADLPVLDWEFNRKLGFVRRIGLILSQMHKNQLFHGCIRPQNVLLDEQLEPVLSDCGCVVIEDSFPGTAETRHEYWAYAAREVRQGQSPDARSDAFSFGRLLYFVLSGEDPDEPDDDIPRLDRLRDAPAGLVRIIRKATQRDAGQRYATIDEMLDELGKYQQEGVGVLHPEGLEGKERPKDPPAEERKEKEAKKAEEKPKVRQAPIQVVVGAGTPDVNDPLEGSRQLVVGGIGIVLLGAAGWLAFKGGDVSRAVQALGFAGAGLGSAMLPGTRRPYLARTVWLALCVALVWLGDPWSWAAAEGRRAQFTRGTPAQRVAAVVEMSRHGKKEFRELDLSGLDFSGKNLAGLDFARTNLSGGRFVGADLSNTKLTDTDISHAEFADANLEGADVSSSTGWRDALCDSKTRMPEGWSCDREKPRSNHDIPDSPVRPASKKK
jgi:hypothetical protein